MTRLLGLCLFVGVTSSVHAVEPAPPGASRRDDGATPQESVEQRAAGLMPRVAAGGQVRTARVGHLVYPGATAVRVDLHDAAPGLAADRAAYFVTSDPLVPVARFFHDRWRAQGLVTTADGEFIEEGVVGAFDVLGARQHAVVLRRLPDGRTLVFVTEVPFAALWQVARSRGGATGERVRLGPSQEAPRGRVELRGGKVRVQVTAQGEAVTWERTLPEERP